MTYTPGKWVIDPRASTHVIALSRPICSVSYHNTALPDGGNAENEANAALIAAAPDLLEALETWMKLSTNPHISSETYWGARPKLEEQSRAAIAKVTGKDT